MTTVQVRIDSNRPIFIEADAASFGEIFANANSEDQAEILRHMVAGIRKYPMQVDYLAAELAGEKYADVRAFFAELGVP